MVAALLITAACGSASESSEGTSPPPSGSASASNEPAEMLADTLISALGGERVALATVLMAVDGGYSIGQIVPAGTDGRLRPGGVILDADNAPVSPDDEPSGLLEDDVTGGSSETAGLRSPPPRVPLTQVMENMNEHAGSPRAGLVLLLMLFEEGYSLEQIVLAMLAGDPPDATENARGSQWYLAIPLRLIDEDGNVIEPEQAPEPGLLSELATRTNRSTETTVTPPETTPPTVATPPTDTTLPEPPDEQAGDELSGGAVHHIDTETADLDTGSTRFCLDYSKQVDGDFRLSLTACSDTPGLDVVHDLDAGTITGQVDLALACPGLETCRGEEPVAATVTGSFGPFAYGEQPEVAPENWPFPADHWYSSGMGFWWAGGPIALDVQVSGSSSFWEQTVDEAFTIIGWVDSTLAPSSQRTGELPTDWLADVRVDIDYVETDDPRWDFYTGYSTTLDETGVDIPPWQE